MAACHSYANIFPLEPQGENHPHSLAPGLFSVSSLFDKNCGAAANNKSHSKKNPLDQQDDSESEAANRLQINRRLLHNKIEEHWIKE